MAIVYCNNYCVQLEKHMPPINYLSELQEVIYEVFI